MLCKVVSIRQFLIWCSRRNRAEHDGSDVPIRRLTSELEFVSMSEGDDARTVAGRSGSV